MFGYLKPYSKILVTGPQRSGTTIAARMIAEDTGKRFLTEEYVYVHSEEALLRALASDGQFVLQCPALQHMIHTPEVGLRREVAVVFMDRPDEEIRRSESRIGWEAAGTEYAAWGIPLPRLSEIKKWAWNSFQKRLIRNPFTVVYSSLSEHPLWVAQDQRQEFHSRQTGMEDTCTTTERAFSLANEDEMKTAALLATALCLASSTEDLKYEIAVREAYTEFAAKVETIREESGIESADRLVPVLMPRRSLWRSQDGSGFFERLNNDFYVEKLGTGEAKLFRTVEKTNDYVELGLTEGGWMTRIYEDHIESKAPGAKGFKRGAEGKWER